MQSFSGLPIKPPWNVIALTRQAPTLGLFDLLKVNKTAALAMMQYERDWTYGKYDGMTAGEYLLSLNFPPDAHQMLFDVFARSFFNPGSDMSGAELLMMFHFYFAGNPEGPDFRRGQPAVLDRRSGNRSKTYLAATRRRHQNRRPKSHASRAAQRQQPWQVEVRGATGR